MLLCRTALEILCDCYTNTTNACGRPQRGGGGVKAMWTAADRGRGDQKCCGRPT